MCNESISNILLDNLPRMPTQSLRPFSNYLPSIKHLSFDSTLSQLLNNFDFRLDKRLQKLLVLVELNSLKESVIDLLHLVMKNVFYQNVDKIGNMLLMLVSDILILKSLY